MKLLRPHLERPILTIPRGAGTLAGFRAWATSDDFPQDHQITYVGGELIIESGPDQPALYIPPGATTLSGFMRWAISPRFPREGYRISYIAGELLIDMSPEEINVHNWIKYSITLGWGMVVEEKSLGRVYPDRVLLTHKEAELSSEPDATFALWETLKSGRLRAVPKENDPRRSMLLQGTPDCVVEIVSPSSVRKDTKLLRAAYHRAGIPEYWLIDGTREPIKWELLRHEANGYVPTRAVRGWMRSDIFNHSFKFEHSRDPMGNWRYSLRSKA